MWTQLKAWIVAQLDRWAKSQFPVPKPPEEAPSTPAETLDLSTVRWLGDNYTKAVAVPRPALTGASIAGDKLSVRFTAYSWPVRNGEVALDAIACLFYERDGGVTGGKFDWIRKGGQPVKGLENVMFGYHGHVMPAKGAKAWVCWVSVDGKQRSNLAEVAWK